MPSRIEKLFDKRILTRNIRKNKLSHQEYAQYLEGLEDAAHKAVPLLFEAEQGEEETPAAPKEEQ